MSKKEKDKENIEEIQQTNESSEIEELRAELEKTKDTLLRTAAEYDNFRKRSQREKDAIMEDANALAIGMILPVLDSLENALNLEDGTEPAEISEKLLEGVKLVYKLGIETCEKMGVEQISGINEEFDPETQYAVSHIESGDFGENTVSMVIQKGYRMGGKVIRPAMVQVAN